MERENFFVRAVTAGPLAALLCCAWALKAADWPMAGGEIQKQESVLNQKTIGGLTLLWSKHLGRRLSSPVILGRVITNKGFQELIFVTSSEDSVFAVDADLGRVLWERRLEDAAEAKDWPVTPAFTADSDGDDDDDEKPRPLFALSSHRELFALRTINGRDAEAPEKLDEAGTAVVVERGKVAARTVGLRPVAANGLLYELKASRLVVRDAASGREVFSTEFAGAVGEFSTLAVANGHVVFSSLSGDLYCFGLPLDL